MALSIEESKRQRRGLLQEIAAEHRRKDREKLRELRARIRNVKGRRRQAMHKVVERCRSARLAARERAKQRVRAIREEARALVQRARSEETQRARASCEARKELVRKSAQSTAEKKRGELAAEQAFQGEMKRIEGWAKKRKKEQVRVTAAEARQESDDEVRSNIDADLLPLFERVKRSIKGSSRQSRTEAMLEYAQDHPDEVVEAQEELSRREIARLVREEAELARATRSPRRYKPSAAELAAIPF